MLGTFDHPLILRAEMRMLWFREKQSLKQKGKSTSQKKIHGFKYEIDSNGLKELR